MTIDTDTDSYIFFVDMDNSPYYWVSHVFVFTLIKLLKNEKKRMNE